jgi:hypothetical protein
VQYLSAFGTGITFRTERLGIGNRFVTGDVRAAGDAEPLNLAHPLVEAAIASARNWPGGSLLLHLTRDADPELAALAGKTGMLGIAIADYTGFEPVQRLIAAAVVEGVPIDPLLAARIARLPASQGPALDVAIDPPWLDDAVDEATFVDQREVEKSEQAHFEQALGQLERFVEDKILVCRRERAGIELKLKSARSRRDTVVGSSDRERIEVEIARLEGRDEELEGRIRGLESREDKVYRKWQDQYHGLRYQPPSGRRLFRAAFQIVPAEETRSC